ncbi:protein male-specific lethal-3 isoform X2 [Manduca sexta]|uniref:protein male-specific lethal-3 isoform X2 n=1 Tax=Manduca sexta TaxID=7130 RepID=UPI00188F36BB|nr:protein male-specific lethal-3 isoform X2 [Manduca sexta]
MVSTRGIRYKFSEGERVLCYEPDPTKAKVLYDSKVLEVIEGKDRRGRRSVEYLIHFQGWNSSWDRCVSEDFVLKDTEENRQLQRDLAEKSQLQLLSINRGAYLYRRERKKGGSNNTGAGPAKRPRHGFSDDGSSTSTQPDEGETGDTDSSSASGSSSQPRSPPPPNIAQVGRAHITLPSALRDRLTFDYHLVVKRGRLSRLPATPCAAQILESFVKWFARAGAWHQARGRHDPPQKPDILDVSCRLNLVREVADGLRVYFDFILRGHLLYKQELNQYHEICGQFIDEQEEERKSSLEEEMDDDQQSQDEALNSIEDEMKSPKMPEYAHLPPDPMDADRYDSQNNSNDEADISKMDLNDKCASKSDSAPEDNQNGGSEKSRDENCASRIGNVARRLRSHKSVVSQSENEEPAPSTSTGEPRTFETLSSSVGSSGSSLSEGWARGAAGAGGAGGAGGAAPGGTASTRTPLSLLLDKVAKWQIIPREGTEHLPCRVYGAIHLARLFVKLPDFLNATQMPDFKLKLIVKHIDMFVQYLDEHSEWFGEVYYIADSMSRSH